MSNNSSSSLLLRVAAALLLFLVVLTGAEEESAKSSIDESSSSPKKKFPAVVSPKKMRAGKVPLLSEEEEPHFLAPQHLEPGQMSPILWREDGKKVDPETYFVGLPPQLSDVMLDYCDKAGILELSQRLLYSEDETRLEPGENRLYKMNDGSNWGAMGPSWTKTDLTWIDAADEASYELTLGLLRDGGFDVVLDAMAKKFKLNSLMVQGVGVIVVSRNTGSNMHFDIGDTGNKFFNIIFPITIPTSDVAQLNVGDRNDHERDAPVNFRKNVGILLGGQSRHGTGVCDYQEAKEFRVGIAIYVADLTEENVEEIASDSTSLFPNQDDVDWFWSQRGRVWDGEGRSLLNDTGRKSYTVKDSEELDCPALAASGECEKDLTGIRTQCLTSCNVYMEDEVYYETFFGDAEKEEL